ncbi:hypothetical protein DFJ74DRAFT_644190 [Hyaloraphidium curvatum]|nr:hypothetical protein DFJ74DRAFT_644190 [Hyaloraphidium curvatum]
MAPLRVRVASVRGVDFVDISDRAAQRSAAAIVGAAVADFVRQHPTFDVHPAEQALYITFNKLDPGKPLSAYFDEGRAGVLEARSGLDELHLVRTGDGKCHLVEDYHQPRFRIPLSTPPEVLDDLVSLSAAGSMPFELRLQAKEMTREEMLHDQTFQ